MRITAVRALLGLVLLTGSPTLADCGTTPNSSNTSVTNAAPVKLSGVTGQWDVSGKCSSFLFRWDGKDRAAALNIPPPYTVAPHTSGGSPARLKKVDPFGQSQIAVAGSLLKVNGNFYPDDEVPSSCKGKGLKGVVKASNLS